MPLTPPSLPPAGDGRPVGHHGRHEGPEREHVGGVGAGAAQAVRALPHQRHQERRLGRLRGPQHAAVDLRRRPLLLHHPHHHHR